MGQECAGGYRCRQVRARVLVRVAAVGSRVPRGELVPLVEAKEVERLRPFQPLVERVVGTVLLVLEAEAPAEVEV